ncbi:Sec-independent protein translocase protein TatB [Neisseria sp. oral taxon 014]|uniref:Sec-independent protein translocase protein TatB n=1 Tax=Neisseria sp. oral taxon 014 TaxID=641148 RepID=UPI0025F873CA|nr:Sec-independent protein translocase protein TatB [Neisseria sp. oral taxon 014]
MFDFGLGELLLVGVVALIVIGPERLPKAARMAGNMVGKLQRLVSSVKQELNTQIELEELRKAKQEFESAASQFKDDLKEIGGDTQNDLNEISDGLKPWERLPEQRTPADFGVDEHGNPLPQTESAQTEETVFDDNGQPVAPVSTTVPDADNAHDADKAWHDYLTLSARPSETPEVSYIETLPAAPAVLHTASLRKQAMSRKRDLRPKYHAKPKLRIRKK